MKQAGAKYFVPTAEYHDDFSLWDSTNNPFSSAKMGPHRDLIGEMGPPARRTGP